MPINQTYNLDLVPNGPDVMVKVSQYDVDSRTITFNLYKQNELYTVPNGTTATVRGTKSDQTGFEYPCTVNGSTVSFTVKQQMTIFNGKVLSEIRLVSGGEILGTANFILFVEKAALSDDIQISETDLPLLEEAIEAAATVADTVARVSSIVPSNTGTDGQVLTKSGTGAVWANGASDAVWGNITGTLSAQTDLQNALNQKPSSVNGVSTTTGGDLKINRTREFTVSSTTAVTYTSPSGKTYTRRYSATGLTGVTVNTIANVLSCTDNTVSNIVCETRASGMYIYFQVTPSTSAKVVVEFTESEAL